MGFASRFSLIAPICSSPSSFFCSSFCNLLELDSLSLIDKSRKHNLPRIGKREQELRSKNGVVGRFLTIQEVTYEGGDKEARWRTENQERDFHLM